MFNLLWIINVGFLRIVKNVFKDVQNIKIKGYSLDKYLNSCSKIKNRRRIFELFDIFQNVNVKAS